MVRWGKNPAPAAGAGGEVAVQKVDKIEFHSLVSGPRMRGLTPAPAPRGVVEAGEDINKKAEEFIKQRKQWFHRP
ncbi:hypothetical protein HU200_000012 [Digitaria exilis]|uniref:Uncharacterized protein n=1 Tax=Digitaria exilis TaxID=1010633 RepID=A0A835G164_9POAL|nr:hypothetical protein HU200_020392 [Digitaria exilis]KAF8784022.1 hypothetical protein HU200_000012 [Digitaria exilis]